MSQVIHFLKASPGRKITIIMLSYIVYWFLGFALIASLPCTLCHCARCPLSSLIMCPHVLVRGLYRTDGQCCIIHECVPPCAWTSVTRSCQQCILEHDGTGCAEDTLQGLLACGGLWEGPGDGCASLGFEEEHRGCPNRTLILIYSTTLSAPFW